MIQAKFTINNVDFRNFTFMDISKSMSEYETSSSFVIQLDSPYGRHKSDFTVGNEITIFADKDASPTTKIFTGIIEKVSFWGQENSQSCIISGRDYTARLQDITVQPIVYTNSEISTIVTNIINNEINGITTTNVDVTTTTLTRIAFNHHSVYEALKLLAELAGFIFYIDENKDLHFEKRQTISSGLIINNTNIIRMPSYNTTKEGMFNSIWVYGDKRKVGEREILVGNGGSVFTLVSRPHDTEVLYLGSIQRGGVYQMNIIPTSGIRYLVNFYDRQLIFVSGTDLGYDATPPNGGSILINYNRDVPIIKYGQDSSSIAMYGMKEKIIDDRSINDPNTAEKVLQIELQKANPFRGIEAIIKGWFTLNPGDTVDVVLDDFNLNETGISILDISYSFNRQTQQSEQVIKIRLDKKIKDITDEIADIRSRIDKIESQNRQASDILPRLQLGVGSMLIVGSYWAILTSFVTGSQYHLYDTNFISPINPFHLASGENQGYLAGSYTGSAQAFTGFAVQQSGGYNY